MGDGKTAEPRDAVPADLLPARPGRAGDRARRAPRATGWTRTDQRYAYRCLPLSIANASGWEVLAPVGFEATWRGDDARDAITIRSREDPARAEPLATSHFGHGILTLHTGYLFRTSPGWALWVRGSPNVAKRHLVPLDGLVETDWLDFPFTMNWRFTRAGTVGFEKGEPFCFITPFPHALLDAIQPVLRPIEADPALKAAYEARASGRSATSTPASPPATPRPSPRAGSATMSAARTPPAGRPPSTAPSAASARRSPAHLHAERLSAGASACPDCASRRLPRPSRPRSRARSSGARRRPPGSRSPAGR